VHFPFGFWVCSPNGQKACVGVNEREGERVRQTDEKKRHSVMKCLCLGLVITPCREKLSAVVLSAPDSARNLPGQMSFHTLGNLRLISTFFSFLFKLWKTKLCFHTLLISPCRIYFPQRPFQNPKRNKTSPHV